MTYPDNVVVIGAGKTSAIGDFPDRAISSLTAEALGNALEDAGIERCELDGIVTNYGSPHALNYDTVCESLGLDVRYASQKWTHGRFTGPAFQEAVLAIKEGLAEYVAAGVGVKYNVPERSDQLGGGHDVSLNNAEHLERPWYGMTSPVASGAMATRYYMEKYGASGEDLAHVSVAFRNHASKNPKAHFTEPIRVDDHQQSQWFIEPLRLYDLAPFTDGGAYIILTSEENVSSIDGTSARVTAMEGLHAGRNESQVWARPGIGIQSQQEFEYDAAAETNKIFERADVKRTQIDGLYIYDALAPNVWFTLERWGFCKPGTAHKFTRDGAIELGGELPVNTNGGLLSEGQLVGWGHLAEIYKQISDECGPRQLDKPEVLQWATPFGDSIIFERVKE